MNFFEILKMALRNIFKPTEDTKKFDYFILLFVIYLRVIRTVHTLWSAPTIGNMFCINECGRIFIGHCVIFVGQFLVLWPLK
jgi:hypothetical protein